jgi:endonuclease-3
VPARNAPRRRPGTDMSAGDRKRRARTVLSRLKKAYPDANCALTHDDAYQLLAATILSAQCTDARVNMVTPALFEKYPTPDALARARQSDLEDLVRSTGFFRNKATNLIGMAQAVVADHDGRIPDSREALQALPGVGRKTANVVLGNAFGKNDGVVVDTHVGRIARLLELTEQKDPVKVEQDLMPLFPQKDWALLAHLLISHGRSVCIARRPQCTDCVLADRCPSAQLPV